MPTVNYVNPNSGGTPYGDWKPQGPLAGWQYADKMKDYRTTKDLSDEASFLANEMTGMQNTEFLKGEGLRDVERAIKYQRGGHELNRIPSEEGVKGMQADEQYSVMASPKGRKARIEGEVAKSIYGLGEARRKNTISNTLSASAILQGIPLDSDPNLIVQQLEKSGVDVSGLSGPDTETTRQKLHKLRSLDPELLKSEYARILQADKDKSEMDLLNAEWKYRKELEAIKERSEKKTASSMKEDRLLRYEQEYERIMSKPVGERTAQEQAKLQFIESMIREYQAQQGAIAEREVTTPSRTLRDIEGKPSAAPPRTTAKSKTITLPEVGEVEVLETMPDGSFKFRTKEGRTGVARP
jgi:hypothetical protein